MFHPFLHPHPPHSNSYFSSSLNFLFPLSDFFCFRRDFHITFLSLFFFFHRNVFFSFLVILILKKKNSFFFSSDWTWERWESGGNGREIISFDSILFSPIHFVLYLNIFEFPKILLQFLIFSYIFFSLNFIVFCFYFLCLFLSLFFSFTLNSSSFNIWTFNIQEGKCLA